SSTFGGGPGGNMSGRGSAPVTSAAVNQAQTVLAPPQVAALQRIQQEQQTQQQLRQLVSETMAANRPTSSKSTGKWTSGAPNTGSGGAAPPRRRGSGG